MITQERANDIGRQMSKLEDEVCQLLMGKKARIISNYNGQPYGRSKKSMNGQVRTIEGVIYSRRVMNDKRSAISVLLEGTRLYICLDEVEIIE